MKNITKYMMAAIMMCAATGMSAQALSSGYFLDGYLFKHQLNPALQSDKAYVSVPVLGNINIGTRGNIGLGNFLYPTANVWCRQSYRPTELNSWSLPPYW